MKVEVGDIIKSIKYGVHFRSSESGEIKYLKGTHFDEDFELTKFEHSYVDKNIIKRDHFLEADDVILASKGFRNYAWRYSEEHGACVASSLFFVIKVNTEIILSEYLTLVLNAKRIQHQLKLRSMGVTIPSISSKEIKSLRLDIPEKNIQEKIIIIANALKEKVKIQRNILEKEIAYRDALIHLLTKKETPIKKQKSLDW